MQEILEMIADTLIDAFKILPFLFITYLIMEYIEHKLSEKSKKTIKKAGHFGPAIGGALGLAPQCGFAASATNLYAARIVTLGTLIAIYLTTSDEMLPILLTAENGPDIVTILKILGIKFLIGVLWRIYYRHSYKIYQEKRTETNRAK